MGIPGDTGVSIRKEGGRGDGPVFQLSFREATTEGLDLRAGKAANLK